MGELTCLRRAAQESGVFGRVRSGVYVGLSEKKVWLLASDMPPRSDIFSVGYGWLARAVGYGFWD